MPRKSSNQREKTNIYLILIALFVLFFLSLIYTKAFLEFDSNFIKWYVFFDKNEKISKAEALGVTGDFLGGVINPILSFFSFIAILYTISLQSKELQATRSELSRTAAAQEKSVSLLNEQISAQRLEKFENTFFSLINQLNHSKPDGELISTKLEECFRTSHIKRVRDAVHEGNYIYDHYYRLIFQILKFIAYSTPSSTYRAPSVLPPSTEEKFYAGILRSVLDHGKTQILAINACCLDSSDSFFEYMALIKRYSLLEHMPFEIESANKKQKKIHSYISAAHTLSIDQMHLIKIYF